MVTKLLTAEQIDHYRREGYLHVPGVYSEANIAEARRLIEADIASGGWASAPYHNEGVTTDIYERIPELADIVWNDKYLWAMEDLFGPQLVMLAEPAIHRSRYYYWHKDSTFLDEQGEDFHWKADFQAAMTVLYLQPNHPDYGGGISVVPRTHRDPDFYHRIPQMSLVERALLKGKKILKRSHFDRLDQHPELNAIASQTGDLLVLDMRIDHKGTPAKKPVPYTKYGIMNIACTGQQTAANLRRALRKRPAKYYAAYLAKEGDTTPKLEEIAARSGVEILL
ncbi:MAG: phytanoyl-CoA dioxygenase family protein [Bacteroidota bacterium]